MKKFSEFLNEANEVWDKYWIFRLQKYPSSSNNLDDVKITCDIFKDKKHFDNIFKYLVNPSLSDIIISMRKMAGVAGLSDKEIEECKNFFKNLDWGKIKQNEHSHFKFNEFFIPNIPTIEKFKKVTGIKEDKKENKKDYEEEWVDFSSIIEQIAEMFKYKDAQDLLKANKKYKKIWNSEKEDESRYEYRNLEKELSDFEEKYKEDFKAALKKLLPNKEIVSYDINEVNDEEYYEFQFLVKVK
jgi:hypothetical protein